MASTYNQDTLVVKPCSVNDIQTWDGGVEEEGYETISGRHEMERGGCGESVMERTN